MFLISSFFLLILFKVKELIDRLAEAAKKTNGFFTFRKNKLFGNLIIIVNKSQDILQSDEAALQSLIDNNPSLIIQIEQYFTGGPTVVLLPTLQWDYDDEPDFNEPGNIRWRFETIFCNFKEFLLYFKVFT